MDLRRQFSTGTAAVPNKVLQVTVQPAEASQWPSLHDNADRKD
jgi:hypothetical protein